MSDDENQIPWWAANSKKDILSEEMGYRRSPLTVAIALLSTILVACLAFWGMTAISPSSSRSSIYGSTEHMSSISAVLNQCGNIFEFPVQEKYVGVYTPADITPDKKGNRSAPLLPMIIQPYGFMLEQGLVKGKPYYSPEESKHVQIGNVLRSMYDGKIIIWYQSNLIDQDLILLRDFAWKHKDRVTVIARKGAFPEDRSLAFATWGITMSCGLWSEDVVMEFIDFVDENQERLIPTEEPPAAQLKDGKFPVVAMNPFEVK